MLERERDQNRRAIPRALASVLLLVTATAPGEDLGRLFSTPEEREMLEALRHQPPVEQQPVPAEDTAPVAEPVPKITVNGVVQRSRGNNTAWINGESTLHGGFSSQPIRVDTHAIHGYTVPIQLPNGRSGVRLKVGETYDPSKSLRVIDAYEQSSGEPGVRRRADSESPAVDGTAGRAPTTKSDSD